jgi:hypothetical protein
MYMGTVHLVRKNQLLSKEKRITKYKVRSAMAVFFIARCRQALIEN